MKILIRMALRNLLRNKRRSLITLSAVTFGLGAMIFLRAFIHGAHHQMIENITANLTSDAQVVPAPLENIYNTNGAIEDPEAVRQLLRSDPRVLGFAERVLGGGLVSSETQSMATFIVGFDPDQEVFIGSRRHVTQGEPLTKNDTEGIALGEKMRRILGLKIGDKVIVTAQDYYGSLAGGTYTLLGTFETGNDQIDNGTVMLLTPTAQKLLSFEHRLSKVALKIDPRASIQEVVSDLRKTLKNKTKEDLRILTWEDLLPMLGQLIRFQDGMAFVIVLIVLTVVAAGILNTLMMSLIERIREFGLMLALGTKPSQVAEIVLLESFFLTLLGAFLGVIGGVGFAFYFGHEGINLSRFFSSTLSNLLIGSEVYPRVDWYYLFLFLLVVFVSNFLVSLYPAWKAGQLTPVEAMRQAG